MTTFIAFKFHKCESIALLYVLMLILADAMFLRKKISTELNLKIILQKLGRERIDLLCRNSIKQKSNRTPTFGSKRRCILYRSCQVMPMARCDERRC